MRAYGKNVEKNCGQITEGCGSIRYLWNEQAALSEIKRQVQKPSESPYMDSADLYLTKPGGISVTEAAVKNIPMSFINAVAGCEQYNMDFFVGIGAAFTADSPAELAEKSITVLKDDRKRKRMESALQEYRQSDGAERIFYEMNRGEHI